MEIESVMENMQETDHVLTLEYCSVVCHIDGIRYPVTDWYNVIQVSILYRFFNEII